MLIKSPEYAKEFLPVKSKKSIIQFQTGKNLKTPLQNKWSIMVNNEKDTQFHLH